MTIKHLVLCGGGIKGISMIGALRYMTKRRLLDINILHTIAGSSVGALIGALLVIGYTPIELFQELKTIDIQSYLDPNITNMIDYYGLDTGHKLVAYIKKMFKRKGFNENISLKELYNLTKTRLILTATNVNCRITEYFDYVHHPDVNVIDVIRASISVPIYFTTPKYEGCYYVDGGVLDNFPLHLFHHSPPETILAIKFRNHRDIPFCKDDDIQPNKIENAMQYFNGVISCLLEEIEFLKSIVNQNLYHQSTILIDRDSVNTHPMNFTIDSEQQLKLYQIGISSAQKYLKSDGYLQLRLNMLSPALKTKITKYIE